MERDPQTKPAAAEKAAAQAPGPETTDGVHTAAEPEPAVAAAPAEAGESAPEQTAAEASVAQARDDAADPERGDWPAAGRSAAADGAERSAAAAPPGPEADAPAAERESAPAPAAPAEPDYKDQYVRAMAELDNVRKRARRDVSQAEGRGIAKLARELLPALDNFARALDAAEAQPENRDHHLTDGIRLVQNELLAALARVGIEPESPKGERFDPHRHEAIAQQPVEGAPSGTIVEVYSQGYHYRDDVLRPAKVVVAA
jgi:molecular chaperone GrpE